MRRDGFIVVVPQCLIRPKWLKRSSRIGPGARRLLLGFVLAATVPLAWSDTFGPWIGIKTYHISREEPVNEDNKVLGLRYNRWFGARFDNSFNDPSWAIGYAVWQWDRPFLGRYLNNWDYTLRLSPGVAYGYGNRFALSINGFTPGIIPSVGLEWSFSQKWILGTDLLYIWTEQGGVFLQGVHLAWKW